LILVSQRIMAGPKRMEMISAVKRAQTERKVMYRKTLRTPTSVLSGTSRL
jgi:hypothetical protein